MPELCPYPMFFVRSGLALSEKQVICAQGRGASPSISCAGCSLRDVLASHGKTADENEPEVNTEFGRLKSPCSVQFLLFLRIVHFGVQIYLSNFQRFVAQPAFDPH